MKRNELLGLVGLIIFGLTITSCSVFRKPKPGEPGSAELYELAWVHPRVIKGDEYFTLITAERLDSFIVAREDAQPSGPPAVIFQIPESGCQVKAELGSAYGSFRAPVMSERLEAGVYRLTLNPARYTAEELPAGQYSLIVKFCNQTKSTRFFRD